MQHSGRRRPRRQSSAKLVAGTDLRWLLMVLIDLLDFSCAWQLEWRKPGPTLVVATSNIEYLFIFLCHATTAKPKTLRPWPPWRFITKGL